MWYNPADGSVDYGPAYLGLRDGYAEARLYAWVVRDLAALPASRAAGGQGALLRLAEQSWEVYRWTGPAGLDSPVAINQVRRALLQAAVDASPPPAR